MVENPNSALKLAAPLEVRGEQLDYPYLITIKFYFPLHFVNRLQGQLLCEPY